MLHWSQLWALARKEVTRMRRKRKKRQTSRLPQGQLRKAKDLLAMVGLFIQIIKNLSE